MHSAMRYSAQVYTESANELGNVVRTLSSTVLRCAVEAKSGREGDVGEAGLFGITVFDVVFHHADARENGIGDGSVVRIDGLDMRVTSSRPGGMALRQYLHCVCELAEDI